MRLRIVHHCKSGTAFRRSNHQRLLDGNENGLNETGRHHREDVDRPRNMIVSVVDRFAFVLYVCQLRKMRMDSRRLIFVVIGVMHME